MNQVQKKSFSVAHTKVSHKWLAPLLYLLALILEFAAYVNGTQAQSSFLTGTCYSTPTVSNFTAQYGIAGIIAGIIGLFLAFKYSSKPMRAVGVLLVLVCLLAALYSYGTAGLRLCSP